MTLITKFTMKIQDHKTPTKPITDLSANQTELFINGLNPQDYPSRAECQPG